MLKSAALLLALAAPLGAQSVVHPNFSGTWVLDAAKSSATGAMNAPSAGTYVVTHVGDSISIDQKMTNNDGEQALKKTWKIDGKVWTNSLTYQGTEMTLRQVLSWNGAVLNVHTNTDFAGTPVEQEETWTLSADGKGLTQVMNTVVNGEVYATLTLVFTKK